MRNSIAEKDFYLDFIDGLRGTAILMVVAVHAYGYCQEGFAIKPLEDFIRAGSRGVQLFFMLSAFVLFNSLNSRARSDQYPKLSFYLRRAFRILPLYYLMVFYCAYRAGALMDLKRIFLNLTFLFGFVRFQNHVELVPGSWTLFCEEFFYFFLPFLFVLLGNFRRVFKFFILSLLISLAWFKLAAGFRVPDENQFIFQFPLSQVFCFALGIVAYYIVKSDQFRVFIGERKNLFFLDTAALFSVYFLIRSDYQVATFALFFLILASAPPGTFLGMLMRNRLLMLFGAYCYSIYLLHPFILEGMDPFKNPILLKLGMISWPFGLRFVFWFFLAPLVCLFFGFITFKLIEKPSVNVGKIFIKKLNSLKFKS